MNAIAYVENQLSDLLVGHREELIQRNNYEVVGELYNLCRGTHNNLSLIVMHRQNLTLQLMDHMSNIDVGIRNNMEKDRLYKYALSFYSPEYLKSSAQLNINLLPLKSIHYKMLYCI